MIRFLLPPRPASAIEEGSNVERSAQGSVGAVCRAPVHAALLWQASPETPGRLAGCPPSGSFKPRKNQACSPLRAACQPPCTLARWQAHPRSFGARHRPIRHEAWAGFPAKQASRGRTPSNKRESLEQNLLVMMRDISSDDLGKAFMAGLNENADKADRNALMMIAIAMASGTSPNMTMISRPS